MIMKWWILVVLVALLLFSMMFRERFEPTQKIKAPPYDDAEKERIFRMAPFDLQDRLRARAARVEGGNSGDNAIRTAREQASTMVARFYEVVYKSATSPITVQQIDSFVTRNTHPTDDVDLRPGMRELVKAYFIDQASGQPSAAGPTGAAPPSTAPPGTNSSSPSLATPDTSTAGAGAPQLATPDTASSGTGPSASTSPGPPPAPSPAAEPSQKSRIYGPLFTGLGTPDPNGRGNGGGGSGQYPEIWGGGGSKGGAGGTGAAGGSSIVMPPLSSLGLDANAMYFPYSRSPGDMDLIPDPYRVAQTWLPSRYSYNKTEPAPFLTDFSAFLR